MRTRHFDKEKNNIGKGGNSLESKITLQINDKAVRKDT